jgi:hypothetical protein
MWKTRRHIIIFLFIFSFTTLGVATERQASALSFNATLTGSEEVPPVKTKAKGKVVFRLFKEEGRMIYRLTVSNLENVTSAHIHMGKKGENGPPVAILFKGPEKRGKFSGTLSEGVITSVDLIGPLEGKAFRSLVKIIFAEEAYVNVHTDQHPDGEIRGQIK